MTISNDPRSDWTKKKLQSTSQSQTCTKTCHCRCLVVCCLSDHYSFLNLGKTITSERHAQQTHEMHQKLQQVQPALVNRMGPILLHDNAQKYVAQPMLQKLNWAAKFCFASSTIFTQPLAN